jgi:CRP-like cAMP-binding protein
MSRPGPLSREGARPTPSNRLLLALPSSSLQRLWPQLAPVHLTARQVVYRSDERIAAVYFVESGLCSLMTTTRDGHSVESAAIGYEGLLGLTVGLGGPSMPVETIVQVPGSALRLSVELFRRELARDAAVRDVVNRYAHAMLVHLLQTAACNRLHGLEQRCCRWLLAARDRLNANTLPVTQELVATVLGVRRPSLTLALKSLQRAGAVVYRRGQIVILSRKTLEGTACECYAVVRGHLEKALKGS